MLQTDLLERFLRYVKIHTTSDSTQADKGIQPSTERQLILAELLKSELTELGITDVTVTEHGYVCARIPASAGFEKIPPVGFLAHMDTVEEVSGQNVKPQLEKITDGDTIIRTDGTTLLGADDKAGIAAIMTALATILGKTKGLPEIKHGEIEIIFSPDEETGHGMDNVPLNWIKSKSCYTVDGGTAGEIEAECFNAYKSEIQITGRATHTGTARGKMINAATVAANFLTQLPRNESPEATDSYEGFFAPMEISGTIENASLTVFLRDFTTDGMKHRIATIDAIAKSLKHQFKGVKIEVKHTQQYLNMKEELDKAPEVIGDLVEAVKRAGLTPVFKPIRGGTDGSRLTELGIPSPNIFTGGHEFHSRNEWASLNEMTSACKTIIELIKIRSEKN